MTALQLVQDMNSADASEDWATWETFWELYPRKVARLDARKQWNRLSSVECAAAITALTIWRSVWMDRGELQFVPHAATWLHGERWEDELPATLKNLPLNLRPLNSSQVPAILPPNIERTAMPESVRAALAKLRGKA